MYIYEILVYEQTKTNSIEKRTRIFYHTGNSFQRNLKAYYKPFWFLRQAKHNLTKNCIRVTYVHDIMLD